MPKNPPNKGQSKYIIYKYTVIQIEEEDEGRRLFECIPDRWFVDDTKSHCYWPPMTGRSFYLRAVSCEKPDDTWGVCECKAISEGHSTYNNGFKIVKEKCSQKYNTSSADEQINAALYRRKHPVLAMENDGCIEHIFEKPVSASQKESPRIDVKATSKKNTENNTSSTPTGSISSSKQLSVVPGSSASSKSSSTVEKNIRKASASETDNDLITDAGIGDVNGNSESVNGHFDGPVEPVIISKRSNVLVPDSASVRSSNQPRSSRSRSYASNSNRSSGGSRSSRSSSGSSSKQSSDGSRSKSSRSKESRSRCSSSGSHSSRSRSNVLQRSRSDSNSSREHDPRRSIAENRNSQRHKPNKSKSEVSSKSVVKETCMSNANGRTESFKKSGNKSSANGRASDKNNKCSASPGRPSNLPRNSRSRSSSRGSRSRRSISNSHHFRSRSRSDLSNTVRHRRCDEQQQLPATHEMRRYKINSNEGKRMKAVACFVNENNKSRRSLEGDVNATSRSGIHSKRSSVGKHRSTDLHRRTSSTHTRRSYSSTRSPHQSHNYSHKPKPNGTSQSTRASSKTNSTPKDLVKVVKKMSETINQHLKDNDRRLHRMEVTVNKIFVLVGDLSGNAGPILDDFMNDQGFELPDLPIGKTNELTVLKRKLQDKEFRAFFLHHEKDFCCPSKRSTDTVTISKYLKRFISLGVRSKLTLKENGENGITLFRDFHGVYLFLIDVMRAGYRSCNKKITFDEAHAALRIVWGRSKQLLREAGQRRK